MRGSEREGDGRGKNHNYQWSLESLDFSVTSQAGRVWHGMASRSWLPAGRKKIGGRGGGRRRGSKEGTKGGNEGPAKQISPSLACLPSSSSIACSHACLCPCPAMDTTIKPPPATNAKLLLLCYRTHSIFPRRFSSLTSSTCLLLPRPVPPVTFPIPDLNPTLHPNLN